MADKKPAGRGVVDSIYALRLRRFNEYGPGSARAKATPAPTVDQLRETVAAITPKKRRPKKARKTRKAKRAKH